MKDDGNASGPVRCRQSWRGVAPQCCLTEGHEGPCRYKCAGDRCPGLLLPASEYHHPLTCLEAGVVEDDLNTTNSSHVSVWRIEGKFMAKFTDEKGNVWFGFGVTERMAILKSFDRAWAIADDDGRARMKVVRDEALLEFPTD